MNGMKRKTRLSTWLLIGTISAAFLTAPAYARDCSAYSTSEAQDTLYNSIEEQSTSKDLADESKMKAFLDLVFCSYENDPGMAATEPMYAASKKHPKVFKKVKDALPRKEKVTIEREIKSLEREMRDGNG